jgi:hypothetical protein
MEDYEDTLESQTDPDPSDKSDEGYPLKTFDPRDIDISVEQQNIDFLLYKMEYDLNKLEVDDDFDPNSGIIDLNTEFQRSKDLWSQVQMSRLIESILIRFPLPAFYFDTTTKKKWQVIDGLQRLSTIRKFIVDKNEPLRLKGLEFLDREKFENKTFDELPEPMQRTIRNAQVILILIRPGTPKEVKYRIFERVNTGGLKLTKQEIRHAINQGKPAQFLKKLSEIEPFKMLTRLNSRRMDDRELCLRYLAFRFKSYEKYQPPMYHFLDSAMEEIGRIDNVKMESLTKEFVSGLNTTHQLLGKNAFTRQVFDEVSKNYKVNKAIFECLTTCISKLNDSERETLLSRREKFIEGYKEVLADAKYIDSISIHTSDKQAITDRFDLVNKLLKETVK